MNKCDSGDRLVISKVDSLATLSRDSYNKIPINGAKGLIRLLCFETEQCVPLHMHPKGRARTEGIEDAQNNRFDQAEFQPYQNDA